VFTECGLSDTQADASRYRVPRSTWSSYTEGLVTETQVGLRWTTLPCELYISENNTIPCVQETILLKHVLDKKQTYGRLYVTEVITVTATE